MASKRNFGVDNKIESLLAMIPKKYADEHNITLGCSDDVKCAIIENRHLGGLSASGGLASPKNKFVVIKYIPEFSPYLFKNQSIYATINDFRINDEDGTTYFTFDDGLGNELEIAYYDIKEFYIFERNETWFKNREKRIAA